MTTERAIFAGTGPVPSLGRLRAVPAVGGAIRRTKPSWEKPYQRRLVITDFVILLVALGGTQLIWFGIDSPSRVDFGAQSTMAVSYWEASAALLVLWLATLKFYGSRDARIIGSGFTEYTRIADSSFRLFGLVGIAALLLHFSPARGYIVTAFPVGVALLVVSRWGWRQWLRAQRRTGRYRVRVLLVGSPRSVAHLNAEFTRRKYLGFDIVGACVPAKGKTSGTLPVERLGTFDEVAVVAQRERVHAVALAGSEHLPPNEVRRIG
ncbi:MAG: hypothetical protein QOJ68_1831, partial [Blastococcus sp.]|nr:hypothetical protein [Blastococcus sp.]